jgi:hypothetical protein
MPIDTLTIQVRAAFLLGDIIDRLKQLVAEGMAADLGDCGPVRQIAKGGAWWGVYPEIPGARSTRGAIARAILFFVWPR